jgi:OmpA-OmpF porin, OOP family
MNKRSVAMPLIMLTVLAAFSSAATAQDSAWYVGGQLLSADYTDARRSDTGWSAIFGRDFNPNYGLELGYSDFGKITDRVPGVVTVSLSATLVEIAGIGAFEMTERLSAFGRFIVHRSDATLDADVVDVGRFVERSRHTDWGYGIGLRFTPRENFAIRGTWSRYEDVGDVMSIDVIAATFIFRF